MDGDNEDMFSDIDSDQGYEQMRSSEGEDESDDSEGLLGDDGFEHEHTAGRRGANDDDDFAYKVLTPEDIVKDMCEIITEISNIVRLHSTTTRMLLNHMKWDKGKLLETFVNDLLVLRHEYRSGQLNMPQRYYTNADDLFAKAHIASPLNKVEVKPGAAALPSSSSVAATRPKAPVIYNCGQNEECLICFMDCPAFRLTGLACGHRFCKACWAEYLTIKIMTEGMGQTISCAAHNCDVLVDDQRVMELVHDKKVKQRYQQLITNSFVECNMLMRWCPGPDCPNAVRASQPECKPVTCICGLTFCFLCSNEWHEPISCRLLKKWLKKCSDDSETSNWISANTKECPKCHVTIEKNGGCNHITCKNTACKEEFCWICLGPWAPHGSSWYNCNRFDDSAAVQARDAQALSRANLERYLFYYNRYANHLQSMRFEHKLYSQVKSKMEEIQQQNMSWIEVQFLKKAVDVLCQCRRTLMYTYAFSYYLKPTNEVHIFEDNQKDLEHSTELLSEYLERDINKDNVADMKQKVQDKYRYCDNRRVILLEHCKEGSEQDKWKYND